MLELRRISKTFNPGTINEVRSLREISLSIEDGSFVTVIGTNGSGKSTLLNAVAGGFFVDAGSIHLGGCDVTGWPEHRRAAFIGRVFQNPFSGTAPSMSIAENLALAARRGHSRGFGSALGAGWMRELHDRVRVLNMGLESRLANAIGTLSGGERQALTLLMATWLRPELLLLDEHTAALDPKSGDKVIRVSRGCHRARQAHSPYGDALDVPGCDARRPAHHDASRPNYLRCARRREATTASG